MQALLQLRPDLWEHSQAEVWIPEKVSHNLRWVLWEHTQAEMLNNIRGALQGDDGIWWNVFSYKA